MIIRTQTFLNYLDAAGAMQSGDPYSIRGKIFVFYKSSNNNYGHAIAVDNDYYDLITIKKICERLGVRYNEELLKQM